MNIDALLDSDDNTIKVLSLDCFDTLLWRRVAEPIDVFYDLQNYPTFSALGITYKQRDFAERLARKYAYLHRGNTEVTLQEIYQHGFPSLRQDQIRSLMQEEIAAESEVCYAFPPVIKLIEKAKARNIKIIIVSSTYLEEHQLRELLANVLPQDAYAAINQIFCSCEFKIAKHDGLFKNVIDTLGMLPHEILHLGDNPVADFAAPKAYGIKAVYITPLPYQIKHLLWLQSVAALHVLPEIRHQCALPSPYKAIFSNVGIDVNKPEQLIGYVSLGPIVYAFARYITDKVKALQQERKKTKVAFLMRDTYLPALAAEILDENLNAKRIYISRFSSNAASFRNQEDILRYIIENFGAWSLEANFQQLLFSAEEIEKVIETIKNAKNPELAFTQFVMEDAISTRIIENSKKYFLRLNQYLQTELNLQEDDTLVFVDIGYRGTIQRLLTKPLQEVVPGLKVTGYYFMLEDFPEWQLSREGLFDSAFSDSRNFDLSLNNFSLIEELFSNCGDSVIDYTDDGRPIHIKSAITHEQSKKIKSIQTECLRFVRDTKNFLQFLKIDMPMKMLRQTALAELFRILFFLTEDEINFMLEFKHDINKGTHKQVSVFRDSDKYLQSLRRNSVWFLNNSSYSLRKAGDFEQTLALISKKRLFKFFPENADLSVRKENIPVHLSYPDKKVEQLIAAKPTYDGYFSLDIILIQKGDVHIEAILGKHFQWVQLECVEAMNYEHAYHENQGDFTQDISSAIEVNRMEKKAKNLFKCSSKLSSVKLKIQIHDKTLVRMVFRPILLSE
jgi:predicted HAD superfamily hydrolase